MHFMQTDWLDNDEEIKKKIGIVENDDKWGVEPEDFPKDFVVTSFTKIVIENLFDIICDWPLDNLKGIYRMVIGKNEDPEKLAPTDKEIEAEIKRQDEERAKNSEDDEEDFDGEDSDE